jgi:hypothetical protein
MRITEHAPETGLAACGGPMRNFYGTGTAIPAMYNELEKLAVSGAELSHV